MCACVGLFVLGCGLFGAVSLAVFITRWVVIHLKLASIVFVVFVSVYLASDCSLACSRMVEGVSWNVQFFGCCFDVCFDHFESLCAQFVDFVSRNLI